MKLLFLTSRFPYPTNKGDKLRAYYQIKEISKQNEIHLVSLTDVHINKNEVEHLEKYCKSITILYLPLWRRLLNLTRAFFNNKPFQVNYFYTYSFQNKINKLIEEKKPDHIFCQLIRTALYMKDQHHIPSTLDYMDALSKGIERRIPIAPFWMKPILNIEYTRLKNFENLAYEFFNHHTIISSVDRNDIFHEKNQTIQVVQNGIDTAYYNSKDVEIKYDLVFIGNLSYPPNMHAATFIAHEILPSILTEFPEIKILIAGSNPTSKVLKLQNQHIDVKGWFNDIRDAYCSGKIFFAPMAIGTGLQNKLLEAMSLGIPCITSAHANRSLHALHMQNIFIGNDVKDYINHITELLKNKDLRHQIGKEGRLFVEKNYNWNRANEKLYSIFKSKQGDKQK